MKRELSVTMARPREQAVTQPLYEFKGGMYPDYLRRGNGMQFVETRARQFCKGRGVDVGAGKWPFPGAEAIDTKTIKYTPTFLPPGPFDYIFSSHSLEHLIDPVAALEHWKTRLKPGGVVFLYLPHPDMPYWRPQFCRKHRHLFWPADVKALLEDLGYRDVLHETGHDLMWSFAVVGFNGQADRIV